MPMTPQQWDAMQVESMYCTAGRRELTERERRDLAVICQRIAFRAELEARVRVPEMNPRWGFYG